MLHLRRKIRSAVRPELIQAAREFHGRSSWTFYQNIARNTIYGKIDRDLFDEISQTDISLFNGDTSFELGSKDFNFCFPRRSTRAYERSTCISFDILSSFLKEAYCRDRNGRRAYPSAGAMYPVRVFLVTSDYISNLAAGAYHLLPNSQSLEPLVVSQNRDLWSPLDNPGVSGQELCSFYVVYVIDVELAILKYGLRGYRVAVMEAGSMYTVAESTASRYNFVTCLLGSFGEFEICRLFDLNPVLFLPCVIQVFGPAKDRIT